MIKQQKLKQSHRWLRKYILEEILKNNYAEYVHRVKRH